METVESSGIKLSMWDLKVGDRFECVLDPPTGVKYVVRSWTMITKGPNEGSWALNIDNMEGKDAGGWEFKEHNYKNAKVVVFNRCVLWWRLTNLLKACMDGGCHNPNDSEDIRHRAVELRDIAKLDECGYPP